MELDKAYYIYLVLADRQKRQYSFLESQKIATFEWLKNYE